MKNILYINDTNVTNTGWIVGVYIKLPNYYIIKNK